jgi:hypothetical protein
MVFTGMDLPHGTRYASQPATGDHNSGQPPTGNQSAPVAQLDRVPPSEGGGQRFESSRARQTATGPCSWYGPLYLRRLEKYIILE